MPIYEFECRSCGNEFEHMQSFSATTTPACGACGSEEVVRRLGRPAIHFKGSGWYITDSKKKASAESASGVSTTNGADKSSEKSESAPAKTAEPAPESKAESKSESSKPAPVAAD